MEEISQRVEIILYDVLHDIFSYLNIYDLNQASKVCKSWYYAANIEKLKRGPQVMVLQALEDLVATGYSKLNSIHENESVDDFKSSLRIRPSVGFFFTDGKYPASADCDSVPYESNSYFETSICVAHQWTQPDGCFYVAIETLGININDKTIGGERNITAGVFFPELPNVKYSITETSSHCIEQYFKRRDSLLTRITDKLFVSEKDYTCFIIFIYQWKDEPSYDYYHSRFLSDILDAIKTRYDPGSYSVWGGAISDIFTMTTDTRPSYLVTHSTSFCAISISGPSVKSWSIVLNGNLTNSEIEEQLRDFKKQVRLNSSLALLILPSEEDRIDRSKVNIFKNIFPNVTLMSIFNNKNNAVFSGDLTKNGDNPTLKYINSFSYMILTYKF